MQREVHSEEEMKNFGQMIGSQLIGGEVIVLVGDVGTGKTTLTKGLAVGLGIDEPIQSPTFTINRVYEARDNLELRHYDFYRLSDPGIMADELSEALTSERTITVVEWAGVVDGVLPDDRLSISIEPTEIDSRQVILNTTGGKSKRLLESLA